MAVPYYYSELKKGTPTDTEKNNLNKSVNQHEKGFDNPLLAIEPDITSCDIPRKAFTFQKKKKKKTFQAPIYLRSNSLITNGIQMSPEAHCSQKRSVSSDEGTSNSSHNISEQFHQRRSSEPNIYEEIVEKSHEDLSCYAGSIKSFSPLNRCSQNSKSQECNESSNSSSTKFVLDEVEKVQQRHVQILENLNLDVEAMLMPEEITSSDTLNSEVHKFNELSVSTGVKTFNHLSPGTPPLYFASSCWQGNVGTLPKAVTASLGRRVMNEYILQQSDFSSSFKSSGENGKKDSGALEDNIYEEVDLYQLNLSEDYSSTTSWGETETVVDQYASSASEDVEDESGANKLVTRFIGKKKKISKKGRENERATGGFTRWFSTRKKEIEFDRGFTKTSKNSLEEEGYTDVKISKKQRPPLSLPSTPNNISSEKMKRRYIIGSIIDSENSYLNSLQRLIRDYKHPLENAAPPIVSAHKISIMFYRVEQILQCHNIFGIALAQCIRQWDQEEKIGDVFVASFSKMMVLDIYSDYINNFSLAMETAKQASKNKSTFSEFLKVKQINCSDRLSFFGLMVKPVQRFPQFILMLQDLLKETPPGHQDRMSLQLALTQLETLAETLNERKRESEQHHAVREVLKHLGKFSFKSTEKDHFLLRQDDVLQLQLDQNGLIVKSKSRRLFLLNDLLVSVAVSTRSSDSIVNGERLNLKWAIPLQDVDICDDMSMAAKNLMFSYGNKNLGSLNLESTSDISNQMLYEELRDLIHDKDVITRIEALILSLRRTYENLSVEAIQNILSSIQESIQEKCEEINVTESCCLQLALPFRSKSNKEIICFEMPNSCVKRDWATDLRLAKLALDPNNLPAWDIPNQEKRPSNKMPLFVKNFPVFQTICSSEVQCGCQYVTNSSPICQQYLWICSSDGVNSHIVVMAVHSTHLRQVALYHLSEIKIISIEAVSGIPMESELFSMGDSSISSSVSSAETVWLGTENQTIIILEGSCPEKWEEIGSVLMPAYIVQLKYHADRVYVGLTNGSVHIFKRESGQWQLNTPIVVNLNMEPVACLLPLGPIIFCGSGSKIWVINTLNAEVQRNYPIQHNNGKACILVHSGIGIWIALKNSATICLYHTETFQHLQDIDVASNVNQILQAKDKEKSHPSIYVTSLLASKGLLWVGTNVGIVLTVPLPRLEGVPIVTGRLSIAFHAHQGPVQLLLSLQPKTLLLSKLSSVKEKLADNGVKCENPSTKHVAVKPLSESISSSATPKERIINKVTDFRNSYASGSKTLPHSVSLCSQMNSVRDLEEASDVYGLYADLMNITDYDKETEEKLYERLNHSDPELMHLNNVDKRAQRKLGRPRSWDLSTMAVSEDSDSATTPSQNSATGSLKSKICDHQSSSLTQITLRRNIFKSSKRTDFTPKTILILTGGCDYINWRKPEKIVKSHLDAHVMIWEVKL